MFDLGKNLMKRPNIAESENKNDLMHFKWALLYKNLYEFAKDLGFSKENKISFDLEALVMNEVLKIAEP